jgi:hypothetical protein
MFVHKGQLEIQAKAAAKLKPQAVQRTVEDVNTARTPARAARCPL